VIEVRLEDRRGRTAAGPLDRGGHDLLERHRLAIGLGLAAARELDHVRDQPRQLVDLLVDVLHQLAAIAVGDLAAALEELDVRPQARQRRAQLVRRVGHELPLRGDGLLELVEGRVERAGEAAELVVAALGQAAAHVAVARDGLGPLGEAADGGERSARNDRAEPGRQRDPDQREGGEDRGEG
jgi:hypothetical protein